MKYNLSKIMLKAWKIYRKTKGISFGELLDLAFGFVRGCYNQQIKKEQEAENNGEM